MPPPTPLPVATVNIRPGVSILSVLRHLNYRPWYALAEFVDNSLQSYLDHRTQIEKVDGADSRLRVWIELSASDGGCLTVRDNAAGIFEADYPRAFRPAAIPANRTGMAEFGMGMKSAACWFSHEWTARTSALGEAVERIVHFDIEKIVNDRLEELTVQTSPSDPNSHFTEITLRRLNHAPQGRTLGKIKDHLRSIYRVFTRRGTLQLFFDGDELVFPEVRVLVAPFYQTPSEQPVEWRKEIEFDFGGGLRASGFAALRETASTSEAGFALFRRDRLIQGSFDEGYRPETVFGKSNSYRYQRLFGELKLDGFEVTHTKDGFQWDENEEVFLQLLKERLDAAPVPLLEQAEEHRVRPRPVDLRPGAEQATRKTAAAIEQGIAPVAAGQLTRAPDADPPPASLPPPAATAAAREIQVDIRGQQWRIKVELSADPAVSDWLSISDEPLQANVPGAERRLTLRMALVHPFMERFGGSAPERIEPLLRVAVALALAEVTARASGVRLAGTIRRNLNEFLRDALARP